MSEIAKRKRHAAEQRRSAEKHRNDEEYLKRRHASQLKYRRKRRVERMIVRDDRERAERTVARLAKRLSAAQQALADACDQADESASASDDSLRSEDDAEYAEWNSAHVLELFQYAGARSRFAFRRRTGLCQRAFAQLWALVEPFYECTSMAGLPRLRDATQPVVSNQLQFYILLYWLRTVSDASLCPRALALASQYRIAI